MLKTLKYSSLVIMLVSIFIFITQVINLMGVGISQTILNIINSIGLLIPNFKEQIDNLLNLSSNAKMIIVGVIIFILFVYMLISIIACIVNFSLIKKQTKKTITIGKMISIILVDLSIAFFLFSSKASFILSFINSINFVSLILGFLFIIQAILASFILFKFVKSNLKENILKEQMQNVYNYSFRIIVIILIIYFVQKIVFVLLVNAFIDIILRTIDITPIANELFLGSIDFTKSLSEILPANILVFAERLNLPTTLSLENLGITRLTAETLLSISVYVPINTTIFNFLNGITNSFIFNNFIYFVVGLFGSIAALFIKLSNISKVLVKQIILVSIEIILLLIVFLFINKLFIVALILLILAYDIKLLIDAIRPYYKKTLT